MVYRVKKLLAVGVIVLFLGLAFAPSINANISKVSVDPVPDLNCEGELYWLNLTPNANVTGCFCVENIGENGSELDWEIESFPEWGTWTFDPDGGDDLAPGAPVTVDVTVIAPDEIKDDLWGMIKVINHQNPDDFCEISVFWREKSIDSDLTEQLDFKDVTEKKKMDLIRHPLLYAIVIFLAKFRWERCLILAEISFDSTGWWFPDYEVYHPILFLRCIWLLNTFGIWCSFWNNVSDTLGWNWGEIASIVIQ